MGAFTGNTILVTGGSTGIGFALARRFIARGNTVIVCGRRTEELKRAKSECPGLVTFSCDLAVPEERERLFSSVVAEFPALNVVVNNAGIQNRLGPVTHPQEWAQHERELATNLGAPIHLSMLFAPHLVRQERSVIMNVSSGLAFSPLSFMPTYCATKAALHSFTLSLRHQLQGTSVRVVEIVPPSVNTDLGGKGLHDDGAPLEPFADSVLANIEAGLDEFGYGFSENARTASREQLSELFARMNPAKK
jgi:uncharacterized oxidoreductase